MKQTAKKVSACLLTACLLAGSIAPALAAEEPVIAAGEQSEESAAPETSGASTVKVSAEQAPQAAAESDGETAGQPMDEAIVDSGTCGENLTWTLNNAGVMTVSGTGKMDDYDDPDDDVLDPHCPGWQDSDPAITSVVVEEGVTTIGREAFAYHNALKDIQMPSSIQEIGKFAFVDSMASGGKHRTGDSSGRCAYFAGETDAVGLLRNANRTTALAR